MDRVVKPKNQRSKRFLEDKAPKLVENTKRVMFIRGSNCNALVTSFMRDILHSWDTFRKNTIILISMIPECHKEALKRYQLKKPNAALYKRKNLLKPFEDASSLEFFSNKTDSSLFLFGSHNKKRPHNIVIGRLFDHQILDMIELGFDNYSPLSAFQALKFSVGCKPCLVFSGDVFETDLEYMRLKSLLIDFFRGEQVASINLAGLEYVISITAVEGVVYLRVYKIYLKKSGSRTPRVELREIGPRADLTIRRTQLAAEGRLKEASRKPKAVLPKKEKNKTTDAFGSQMGQIHMTRQDYSSLHTRKVKGLKRKRGVDEGAQKKMKTLHEQPKRKNNLRF